MHALASALTDGSKAAKRFKTVQEFSKALTAQHTALISAGSSTVVLAAWYKYTVFLLDLDFQQAQDYHFEMSERLKSKQHDLVRDGHFNAEVYLTCVHSKRGFVKRTPQSAASSAPAAAKPKRKLRCEYHGLCGHVTSDCKHLGAGKEETKG